ncbi:hypothetical protein QBC33DRAFT_304040 [Phialemonium atrogriseum]|uniref:Gpi-anchored protein n=1 Tax=Phialemonium atrogriseum TaxID=1093897 RepID=A0AAJ0FR88_9PEZI|nr:uncharacterized protein QBC33DRAFT_304040 [Phialemonium atrogriseum]KAK1769890.1 hypothetical protein QBC33DRAFT_304040 [Phialemonium atrogriseum]
MGTSRRQSLLRRAATVLLFAAPLPTVCAYQQPFQPAETAGALARRQGGCLANFYSCADQGAAFNNICCQNGQVCRLDANNNPACCPSNAVCTGTAPATFVTPTGGPTPVSFVQNPYFSFPYAASSFANPGACSAAVSQCSRNYDSCTVELGGNNNGNGGGGHAVTIVVPGGGGTTVAPAPGVGGGSPGSASATSICSSLSGVACGGLSRDMCTNRGTSVGRFYFGTGTANVAAATGVPCNGVGVALAGAVGLAGVGFGVVNGL